MSPISAYSCHAAGCISGVDAILKTTVYWSVAPMSAQPCVLDLLMVLAMKHLSVCFASIAILPAMALSCIIHPKGGGPSPLSASGVSQKSQSTASSFSDCRQSGLQIACVFTGASGGTLTFCAANECLGGKAGRSFVSRFSTMLH